MPYAFCTDAQGKIVPEVGAETATGYAKVIEIGVANVVELVGA